MNGTRTYAELRQRAYFRAARELYAVACSVLDDVQNPAELVGSTAPWAKSLATRTYLQGYSLEQLGHEEWAAPPRAENALHKTRQRYETACDAFEARVAAARRERGEEV